MNEEDAKALIVLRDVHRVYRMGDNEVRALDGVTVQFDRGDFWAIMGASGSGKSTMLNLLGCLDRPTSGTYLFDSMNVAAMDDNGLSAIRLQRIGFIFQSFNLIPQLSVKENIELPLYYQGWTAEKSHERAAALAHRVGLGDRLDHRPSQLSGGQQQRVAVARALANDPQVLLADEPTGNLDTRTGEQIMQLLMELNGQGVTVIMVTHEPDIAEYASHHLRMKDGRVDTLEVRTRA
jgi:putative ABC transport system ATP-binding protein